MLNFKITFTHPWFLFLFLLAAILTFIPFFRLPKKFRKNRNRIIDIVLHLVICLLGTLLLSGMKIEYNQYNSKNEIVYLVDISDSTKEISDSRNSMLENLIEYSSTDGYTIGVVTYGFNQKCVVPLSNNYNTMYDKYLESLDEESNIELNDTVDVTASNLSQALLYSQTLIDYPETSKIVVITDGKETDGKTTSIIKSISATGIKIDFCYLPSAIGGTDLQIMDFEYPETHISLNLNSTFKFTIKSNKDTSAVYNVYVDDKLMELDETKKSYNISKGSNNFSFNCAFNELGLHKLTIELDSEDDFEKNNNTYTTYVNLENMNKILIIDSVFSDSSSIISSLNSENNFEITSLKLSNIIVNSLKSNLDSKLTENEEILPKSVDELRAYDQIILNNVSNEELPTQFVENLQEYVQVYGGGLLTIGGTDNDGNNYAYNRTTIRNSILQDMLPVEVVNYTVPIGVVIIVDVSGSMADHLQDAEDAAMSVLDQLHASDMVGVSTLSDSKLQSRLLELTPVSNKGKIISKMDEISDCKGGGTVFTPAIQDAVYQLNSQSNLGRKHIIIVTDCMASDVDAYVDEAKKDKEESNITFSMISVRNVSGKYLEKAKEVTDNRVYFTESGTIYDLIGKDLENPEIREKIETEPFYPTANSRKYSSLFSDEDLTEDKKANFLVNNYFGTKVKDSDYTVIDGEYSAPIYAQWFYGKGTVGSLMLDLTDAESTFLTSGSSIFKKIIRNVMPTSNIRPSDINFSVRNSNYTNDISIYTSLNEGEKITGTITNVETNEIISLNEGIDSSLINYSFYTTTLLNEKNSYSRCSFIAKSAGIYLVEINKVNQNGDILSTSSCYQSFSYSSEYDAYLYEDVDMDKKIDELANKGNGIVVNEDNLEEVFNTFNPLLHKVIDPRVVFLIIIIILFLLDIIVRKFKFKWPHELIRDYKNKKEFNE